MNRRKLEKLRRELARLRRSPQKAGALERLAARLGRTPAKGGKHPIWESTEFVELHGLSIPHHGGRDIPIGTRNSILNQLEEDIAAWEERTEEDDEETDDDNGSRQ